MLSGTRLALIRHAPARHGGAMAGRRDVAADVSDAAQLAGLRARLDNLGVSRVVSSPALRCLQTARALWPETVRFQRDMRLWEQDFGAWEGVPFADLPDLGPMNSAELAAHRPPEGESFIDLCTRVTPALEDLAQTGGHVAVIAHAGVIRAALALALDAPATALRFEVAPLSLTEIVHLPGHGWSVSGVNRGPQ
jgi:alpha-ribazole phosphatase